LMLTAIAGAQTGYMDRSGFNESGSQAAALQQIKSRQLDSIESRLGMRLEHRFETAHQTWAPHIELMWLHDFEAQNTPLIASFNGDTIGPLRYTLTDPARDANTLLVDVGVSTQIGEQMALRFSYNGRFNDQLRQDSASLDFLLRF
ncbi:MAG: autotransporter outer membrane beta-barrel domain-containing protein, partial [Gammaproteobacteria bacterium]|nr:autotransporter outer membrane beta-barrel domain-containing protein [Gammaproteobacteria bacterium]